MPDKNLFFLVTEARPASAVIAVKDIVSTLTVLCLFIAIHSVSVEEDIEQDIDVRFKGLLEIIRKYSTRVYFGISLSLITDINLLLGVIKSRRAFVLSWLILRVADFICIFALGVLGWYFQYYLLDLMIFSIASIFIVPLLAVLLLGYHLYQYTLVLTYYQEIKQKKNENVSLSEDRYTKIEIAAQAVYYLTTSGAITYLSFKSN